MKRSLFLKTARYTFFICAFLYIPVFAQTSKIDSSEMVTLRIDPEMARGAAVADIFEEVNFIPLETTAESLFGKISQLTVTENHFIIADWDTMSILIFSKDGKFRAKINGSSVNNSTRDNEKHSFYEFSMDRMNNEDCIKIHANRYVFYFDLNGKLIKKILSKDYENGGLKFLDKTEIKNHYSTENKQDTSHYEIGLAKDNKTIANYFPFNLKQRNKDLMYSKGESIIDSKIENERFFLTYYNYNIYKLSPKKLSLAYHIIFPAINSLPVDFLDNPAYIGPEKRRNYFEKNPKAIFTLSNTYKIGNLLFFKTQDWDVDNKKEALIYNLNTNALISTGDLAPDTLSSFLPITDIGFHFEFSNNGFHHYDGKYLYTSYSSLAMFAFKEQSIGKNPNYNTLLSNYFKTQNRKSNPIIIQLKPKKD
ncbi:6-bladed beta-propeller [Pedobacter gandavensis]|uniref:6-bladed beta-propeller n=1 Tax=Pedobacter gandavensis TaxID=2679963 RepID=UPI0024793ABF|nr:6-bladed beta-propeller [Pedobacter gandavensis]WGQ10984.1 6-bladed beta-propeller [Pedobacter gandavensis]